MVCRFSMIVTLLFAGPAVAVIVRTIPLREALATEEQVFVAKIERLDPAKPSMQLAVTADLKGRFAFRRLSVSLAGDGEAQRTRQTPQLLERLGPNLEVVIFASTHGQRMTLFGFTNGTWFQVAGRAGSADQPDAAPLTFTHFEPYLRRTFKGTTAELVQTLRDGLSGKRPLPESNANEPPGLGPPVKK